MTKFEVGDKVRIVYEGTVKRVGDFDFDIDTVHGIRYFTPSEPEVRDADLVERRKPKVGDVLENDVKEDPFPIGTIIRYTSGGVVAKKADGQWYYAGDEKGFDYWATAHSTRTLVYLPD